MLNAAGKLTTLFGLFQQTTWNPQSPQVLSGLAAKGAGEVAGGALFSTGFCTESISILGLLNCLKDDVKSNNMVWL